MAKHHNLDIAPAPESVLYVNEPELADRTIVDSVLHDDTVYQDHIRVYIPLDISREAILRRIQCIYNRLGSPSWENESDFISEMGGVISQLEIYDQMWFARRGDFGNGHSKYATMLADEIIKVLADDEGCAEMFPYEVIEELKAEYKI